MSHRSITLISVITIVRNGMPFIDETIKSVLGQSYPAFEYIVIDGESTDGTVEVIKSYQGGISKWISEKDKGIADAFNKGLSFATGEYILFLNADDALATPDVLEHIAEEITQNDYPSLLYGDYNILERNSGKFIYHGIINLTHNGLLQGQILPHPCLFTHRSYFDKYGGFDPAFKIAMDYEWLLRGGFIERIVHVSLVVSNIRDGGISTQDPGKVVDEIISALKKNNIIGSAIGEYKMRGYFFIRAFARKLLSAIGLYRLFFNIRNRFKNG